MLAAMLRRSVACSRVYLVAPAPRCAPVVVGATLAVRGVATRRRRKEMAHAKAVEMRHLLEFAATFDPLRTAVSEGRGECRASLPAQISPLFCSS